MPGESVWDTEECDKAESVFEDLGWEQIGDDAIVSQMVCFVHTDAQKL